MSNILGYNKVDDPNPRDISVLVAASKSDYFYYYNGCWPYYGYTYCWDYPYGGYYDYAFTAYSLFINMVDAQGQPVPPTEQLPAIWLAGINGIDDNLTASYKKARIEARIDQAFAQSPYLDPTP
jgi:hypothetical protein